MRELRHKNSPKGLFKSVVKSQNMSEPQVPTTQVPVRAQMQQLVSHWSDIMQPKSSSKKRGRDDDTEEQVSVRSRTQVPSHVHVDSRLNQSGMPTTHEPFALAFS